MRYSSWKLGHLDKFWRNGYSNFGELNLYNKQIANEFINEKSSCATLKKENVFIINERNITKLTNATYPEYHARSYGQRFLN